MSCQICKHYRYSAGVSSALSKQLGYNLPTVPTNYCGYARVSWERTDYKIRKLRGIECHFELASMKCTVCEKTITNKNDIYFVFNRESYICKKCGNKNEC